jgi:hypothetical protein
MDSILQAKFPQGCTFQQGVEYLKTLYPTYNPDLAETFGLNAQQKKLVRALYKLDDAHDSTPYDRMLLSAALLDLPWEIIVAIACRGRVQIHQVDDLRPLLEPLKTTVPLREELPWRAPVRPYSNQMCGAVRRRSNVPCRNNAKSCTCDCKSRRVLFQLIRINENTRQSWRLPYYFEIPRDGCYSLCNSVLNNAVAINHLANNLPLTERDYLLCHKGMCHILVAVGSHYVWWGNIRHFAFRTSTRLSWTDVHWRDIATAPPAGINSTVYTDLGTPETKPVPYSKYVQPMRRDPRLERLDLLS